MYKIFLKILIIILIANEGIWAQPRKIKRTSFDFEINENLTIINNLSTSDKSKKEIYKDLMILYSKNAQLYETLWHSASVLNLTYYNKLLKKKKNKSDYTFFYKGICEYQLGEFDSAIKSFKICISSKNLVSDYVYMSKIWLGATYYLQGNLKMAKKYWRIKEKNRKIKNEYNYLISTIDKDLYISNNTDLDICQTNRDIKNFISSELIRPNANSWWKLQKALSMVNFKNPDYQDFKNTDKQVDFYDTSILQAIYLANYYLSFFYANMFNSISTVNEQVKSNTNFYRGLYYYKIKEYEKAISAFRGFNNGEGYIYLGASLYLNGNSLEAKKIFKEIQNNYDYKLQSVLIKIYTEINLPINADFVTKVRESIISKNSYNQNKIIYLEYLDNCFIYYIQNKDYLTAYKYYQESLFQSNIKKNNFIFTIRFLESLILSENYTLIETEAYPLIAIIKTYLPSVIFLSEPIGKINILINRGHENEVYK